MHSFEVLKNRINEIYRCNTLLESYENNLLKGTEFKPEHHADIEAAREIQKSIIAQKVGIEITRCDSALLSAMVEENKVLVSEIKEKRKRLIELGSHKAFLTNDLEELKAITLESLLQ